MGAVHVSDEQLRHAHAAWVIALGRLPGTVQVVMTTDQAREALRPAIAAALHHGTSAELASLAGRWLQVTLGEVRGDPMKFVGVIQRLAASVLSQAPDRVAEPVADELGEFIAACCVASGTVEVGVLYAAFNDWRGGQAAKPSWSRRGFEVALADKGYRMSRRDRVRVADLSLAALPA